MDARALSLRLLAGGTGLGMSGAPSWGPLWGPGLQKGRKDTIHRGAAFLRAPRLRRRVVSVFGQVTYAC